MTTTSAVLVVSISAPPRPRPFSPRPTAGTVGYARRADDLAPDGRRAMRVHRRSADGATCWRPSRTPWPGYQDQNRPTTRVAALGIRGLAESGVLLDAHGQESAPVIAWFDDRGADELRRRMPGLPRVRSRPGPACPSVPSGRWRSCCWLRSAGCASTPRRAGQRPRVRRLGAQPVHRSASVRWPLAGAAGPGDVAALGEAAGRCLVVPAPRCCRTRFRPERRGRVGHCSELPRVDAACRDRVAGHDTRSPPWARARRGPRTSSTLRHR
jgi:hypothetical protein